jgi:amidophosphoribosyltransferase
MCGIIGVYSTSHAVGDIYNGMIMLQHRGQDAAGIITYDGRFHLKKENGLVSQVFQEDDFEYLHGYMGLGQVRYRTAGSMDPSAAQPFTVKYPFGISLVHNGNLTNYNQLHKKVTEEYSRYLNSNSDSELVINVLANELVKVKAQHIQPDQIFEAVAGVMERITGGYAIISCIANHGILAFRDPYGIRPLIYGKREDKNGTSYMIASESVALESQGFEIIDDVQPGEAIYIDKDGNFHKKQCVKQEAKRPCIFEYVYLARPDSMIDDISVYKTRLRMGERLAKKIEDANLEIDSIIPIPDTSRPTAIALAQALGIPYREGFIKNRYVGRTFIMPGQEERKKSIKQKLSPVKLEFRNKNVLLVDDSIVRGNTSREIVNLARQAGAKNVYFASAAPPIVNPDVYGVDIPTRAELIANGKSIEEICKEINADKLFYQDIEDLIAAASDGSEETNEFHTGCFDFGYPTPEVTEELLNQMEKENSERDE